MLDTFEEHRTHLRTVAYRMLGSLDEAEDAVQETWLRYDRADTSRVENLRGWLVTVVSRICLDQLRRPRREELVPDPVVTPDPGGPEHEAVLADSVGLALQVVLAELAPAERVAFVLHDLFAVPFTDIAALLGRSPAATKQLAHRARNRVRGAVPRAGTDPRAVVEAFFAAARSGDLDRLIAVLDPDVEAYTDGGTARAALTTVTRGAHDVARRARSFAHADAVLHPVLVNGGPGVVVTLRGKVQSLLAFTVRDDRVAALHALADPDRLARLGLGRFVR